MNVYNDKFTLKVLLAVIFSAIFMICITILIMPIGLIFYVLSAIHYRILKIKHGSKICCPYGLDVMYGIERTKSDFICNAAATFDGTMSFSDFKNHVCRKFQLNQFPINDRRLRRYQQIYKQIGLYTYFLDDDMFNIDDHFTEVTKDELFKDSQFVDNPQSIQSKVNDLEVTGDWQLLMDRMLRKYGSDKLNTKKPPWHIYYYSDGTSTTFLFRYLHVIVDGVHLLRFILEEFGDHKIVQPLPFYFQHSNPIVRYLLLLFAYLVLPIGLYKGYKDTCSNSLHGNKLIGKKVRVVSTPISVQDIKEIKKSCDTFFNAVLFTAFAYAMRCHFREKQAQNARTYVAIPVSLQDLRKKIKTKNSHGFLTLMLTTDTDDPENDTALNRLRKIEKDVTTSVNDKSSLPMQFLVRVIFPILPMYLSQLFLHANGLTATMSNMPGPAKECVRIGPMRSKNIIFWNPDVDPIGMALTYLSHLNTIRVGLQVDRAIIPTNKDAYKFLENFGKEINNLKKELGLGNEKDQIH